MDSARHTVNSILNVLESAACTQSQDTIVILFAQPTTANHKCETERWRHVEQQQHFIVFEVETWKYTLQGNANLLSIPYALICLYSSYVLNCFNRGNHEVLSITLNLFVVKSKYHRWNFLLIFQSRIDNLLLIFESRIENFRTINECATIPSTHHGVYIWLESHQPS